MKPNAIVVAEEVPESSLWYITPGKEYEAFIDFKDFYKSENKINGSGYFMYFLDDVGQYTYCLTVRCPRLNFKPWRIIKVMNVMEVKL